MTALRLLVLFPPMIAIGIVMVIAGRPGLVRLLNGKYRGSFASWFGYLGGVLLAALGIFGLLAVAVWGFLR
jgi:hypothetical protein